MLYIKEIKMVTFYGPDGDMVENPDGEFIKDIIFNKGGDFWQQGSGDSSIEVEGCDESLLFFYDEPYGFFIMRHPDYLVPYDENGSTETVEHDVGGEPMVVPQCAYVDRETAYKIITEYVKNKKFSDCVEWIDLYDIDFENDF